MLLTAIRWFASKLKRRDILAEDGRLYLSRYCVFGWSPGSKRKWPFSVYLHRFHLPDQDTAPHNHPWQWAFSLILSGQYLEVRHQAGGVVRLRLLTPGQRNMIRANDFHYVAQIQGEVWTLFVVGPKTSSWGFQVSGRGFVPWRTRLLERGITPSY